MEQIVRTIRSVINEVKNLNFSSFFGTWLELIVDINTRGLTTYLARCFDNIFKRERINDWKEGKTAEEPDLIVLFKKFP